MWPSLPATLTPAEAAAGYHCPKAAPALRPQLFGFSTLGAGPGLGGGGPAALGAQRESAKVTLTVAPSGVTSAWMHSALRNMNLALRPLQCVSLASSLLGFRHKWGSWGTLSDSIVSLIKP